MRKARKIKGPAVSSRATVRGRITESGETDLDPWKKVWEYPEKGGQSRPPNWGLKKGYSRTGKGGKLYGRGKEGSHRGAEPRKAYRN